MTPPQASGGPPRPILAPTLEDLPQVPPQAHHQAQDPTILLPFSSDASRRLVSLVMMHRIRILVPTCSTFATTQELSEIVYKSAWLQEAIHRYEESDSFALDDPTLDWSVDWDCVHPRGAVANEESTRRLFPVLDVPRQVRENIARSLGYVGYLGSGRGMADEGGRSRGGGRRRRRR